MNERATERDGEHVTAIKSDETGRWVRIPDGVDGVRAYQLLRAVSTDAPSEERVFTGKPCNTPGCGNEAGYSFGGNFCADCSTPHRAPTDEAPERERDNPPWEPTPENVERWAEARRRNGDTEAFVRLTVIARRLRLASTDAPTD